MHQSRLVISVALLVPVLVLAACGTSDDPAVPVKFLNNGLEFRHGDARLRLLPRVLVNGAWKGSGYCSGSSVLQCPIPHGYLLVYEPLEQPGNWQVQVHLAEPATVEALELSGDLVLPGANAWISNGFQSWSQSGAVALGYPPADVTLASALAMRGDGEVIRAGRELSWQWTAAGGGGPTFVAGVTDAKTWKCWTQVARTDDSLPDQLRVRLVCGGAGEHVAVAAGGGVASEPWSIGLHDTAEAGLAAYAKRLTSRRWVHPVAAEAGWNSWYELWDAVTEQDVRANAALAKAWLTPWLPKDAPPLRIVVDDGWQVSWGDWRPNAKFPSGLDGLAKDLKAQGFRMGVWLAPLLVAESDPLVAAHPDWFVEGAAYLHLKNGKMRVLDVTHPDAAAHLQAVIAQIVGWGYDLLKIDFLFAGTYEGARHQAVTGTQAYDRALELIRQAAGPDTVLLAVGAPALPTLRHVDAWRVGGDIAVENFGAVWAFLPNQLRSIAARLPFCQATLCDADPAILRTMTQDEVGFGAWTVATAGGAGFLSDDLRKVDAGRADWALGDGRVPLWMTGKPAFPEDFFPAGAPSSLASALVDHLQGKSSHVVPRIWRMADGRRVAFNPGETPWTVEGIVVPPHAARRID